MHAHLISNTGSLEASHYQAIAHDELRECAMGTQKELIANEVLLGDPKTCSQLADTCAEHLSNDTTIALFLSLILNDEGLLGQVLAELRQHVTACRDEFCTKEVERRIIAAQADADACRELIHE